MMAIILVDIILNGNSLVDAANNINDSINIDMLALLYQMAISSASISVFAYIILNMISVLMKVIDI